jgi:hypothetical protein
MRELMTEEVEAGPGGPPPDLSRSDVRPLARAQLSELRVEVEEASRSISHRVSRAHLQDVLVRIDEILTAGERR